ncbi:hypothetical protein DAPPUDRAFT_55406 [Daphnia pulex]|uniref:Tyrosine-protein phosphatase domain-containing protein n=1 Tax=Daphnia pulex TaxID=6669 RepID=E9GW76_DAPPU|nr:hypothetical protein DAPPUDRAFT_55406 [Daphnia pulex]|eukprot:EFX76298.1 hypothetical protein DAPPUDRAFT_55406 [Daphnia pulex]
MNEDNKNACKLYSPHIVLLFLVFLICSLFNNRILLLFTDDHSRIQLRPLPGQKKSTDYINANCIDGFQQCIGYMGTQGPLPSNFDAFWRMIWEQMVAVIVIITNLVERGRVSSHLLSIPTFLIKHLKVFIVLANFMALSVNNNKKRILNNKRVVLQFHYTNWPDHGTPEHPLPILSFVRQSAAANPIGAGPIIVHCSAGVGRIGKSNLLDAMLKQIECKIELNIRGFLCHTRNQRNFLVQIEEQYIFIHDALLEAIQIWKYGMSTAVN